MTLSELRFIVALVQEIFFEKPLRNHSLVWKI